MSDRTRFWGSVASVALLAWIHLTLCLLLAVSLPIPAGLPELLAVTGALIVFSSPLGLIGWRFYGWRDAGDGGRRVCIACSGGGNGGVCGVCHAAALVR